MKRYFTWLWILLCLSFLKGNSQELLTAQDAVKIALKNNYEIILAKNSFEIDSLNVSPGFAGMLPKLNAVVENDNGIRNLTQTRSDGVVNSLSNARNSSFNYGLILDWTVFDGLQMFARYDQLNQIKKLGEAQLKQAVYENISNVLLTYYNIVHQQRQLNVLDSTVAISRQRLDLAHNRFTIGKASKLEQLNAQVDLNTDQAQLLNQKKELENSKIELNRLLARDSKTDFKVFDEIVVDEELFLPQLEELLKENNPELLAQIINERISELESKRVKAGRWPIVSATTGYNFSDSQSSLGFTTNSNSHGLNYGFRVSMNIFDGFNQNRSEKIAEIQVDNNKILVQQRLGDLLSELNTEFKNYQTSLELIELERKNATSARENLEITVDKYEIGTIPTIEFRTAQLNYINAQLRYSNAIYQAKLAEVFLKSLTGKLPF